MDKALRIKAYWLVKLLGDSLRETSQASKITREVDTLLAETLSSLKDDQKSYKASDYALLKLYSRLSDLIGFKELQLSSAQRTCWQNLVAFIQAEAHQDLRGVAEPLL